jgi:hypothetical protein
MPGSLQLQREDGGLRHYLDGRAVHAGTTLQLLLPNSRWLSGRYEWSFQSDAPPLLYVLLGGDWERLRKEDPRSEVNGGNTDFCGEEVRLQLPESAVLRWPESGHATCRGCGADLAGTRT